MTPASASAGLSLRRSSWSIDRIRDPTLIRHRSNKLRCSIQPQAACWVPCDEDQYDRNLRSTLPAALQRDLQEGPQGLQELIDGDGACMAEAVFGFLIRRFKHIRHRIGETPSGYMCRLVICSLIRRFTHVTSSVALGRTIPSLSVSKARNLPPSPLPVAPA